MARTIRKLNPQKSQAGFTLIEVSLAVMILSTALVTLLGLQSSILSRTLRDDEKQQEMLLARSILSALELQTAGIDIQDKTQPVDEMLKDLNAIPPSNSEEKRVERFKFVAHLKVSPWDIPQLGNDLLRRVQLTIYSENAPTVDGVPQDSFEVMYFVPTVDPNA